MDKKISEFLPVIGKCSLFDGIGEKELLPVISSLDPVIVGCEENEALIRQNEKINKFGIVLSGNVTAKRYSADGAEAIIARHFPSEVFGEILSCPNSKPSPVYVFASNDCKILFIKYSSVISERTAKNKCGIKLIENFTRIMSKQYFELEKKVRYISVPSLRQRITEYLYDLSIEEGSPYVINVPFNRDEMAGYLSVNRSALSRELSRMKSEGIIDYDKNMFKLK